MQICQTAGVLAVAALICWIGLGAPAQAATPPSATVIDSCQYAGDAAAQAAWVPMKGSAPVAPVMLAGKLALRLPCNFTGNPVDRASWDKSVKLDLLACQGVEFKFLCRDAAAVAHFNIYFQSGDGWYHTSFFPESLTNWNTVVIDKSSVKIEGKPAGWGQIKTIRISAWRSNTANTEFYLSDLRKSGELGAGTSVVVLRSETAAQRWPGQISSFQQSIANVTQGLKSFGVNSLVVSDGELTPGQLALTKLLVLPQAPVLSDRTTAMLKNYARSGGKLLAFYTIPDELREVFGIEGNRAVKAPRAGAFKQIQFGKGLLAGAPPLVEQESRNINGVKPVSGVARTLAEWLDDTGKSTGHPAIVATSNTLLMTYILLQPQIKNPKQPLAAKSSAASAGPTSDDGRLLLAMAGALVPEIWQQESKTSLDRIGRIASFASYAEAVQQISQTGGTDPRVKSALAAAETLRESAKNLAGKGKYSEAIEAADAASQQILTAYCLAQKSLPGEFRAFWCHSALGVPGMSWDEAVHRLADNGFTAIFPNMLSGGAAFYPSKVLPAAKAVAEQGDQIRQCLAACRKYGIQIHVWKLNWNLGFATPKEFVDQMRAEGRLQMRVAKAEGKEETWLCPSHPKNQKLEIDAMLELVRDYDLDGIHFDYIRYPGSDYCFCDGCKQRFEKACGTALKNWPGDVQKTGPLYQPWLDWRRSNITTVVKAVSEQARALKPNIKISAAVFRNWNVDRDGVGQDWKLWCDQGYLDFVCPMDYTPSKATFENMVSQQVKWAGRVPCYPGLGVSSSSSRFGADRAIEEIEITRRYKTGGFIIFNYGVKESTQLLPMLNLGITAKPAK
ncbi:MAG: family 10 glycosylhydrolase [Verrucomicrobiota bacterium]